MQLCTRLAFSSLALNSRLLGHAVRTGTTRAALVSEDSKALHAIGYNIGGQLGDLTGFEEENVDAILSGIKVRARALTTRRRLVRPAPLDSTRARVRRDSSP